MKQQSSKDLCFPLRTKILQSTAGGGGAAGVNGAGGGGR